MGLGGWVGLVGYWVGGRVALSGWLSCDGLTVVLTKIQKHGLQL